MSLQSKEGQNIEFKESWRDEYLKTICAFANTNGGTIFIGKDDSGNVTGVKSSNKLLEDIPNQIKNTCGIIPAVTLKKEKGKEIIIIKIKISHQAISYKSKFYKRSGSTTQELNGVELQNFLLERSNTNWESVVEQNATLNDIDLNSVEDFKKASSKRFEFASVEKSTWALLEKLHLSKNRKLTRAAILLFGKSPQDFYPDSYIKIGRFKNEAEMNAMDEIRGNLLTQVVSTYEILRKKYLFSEVRIESLNREEDLEIPVVALREAIVNAIVHRDYSNSITQIKVYRDSVSIWNNGELTNRLTIEKLRMKHVSIRRNPLIADVFFKAGYIEQWGHGTIKMIQECKKAGIPDPIFSLESTGLQLVFLKEIFNEDYLKKLSLNERQIKAVLHAKDYGKINNSEYQEINKTSKRTASSDLQLLTKKGILIKQGATGKGTQYILQRGSIGAKGAVKIGDAGISELDKRISALNAELSKINPHDEVRWEFNKDVLNKIFDLWLSELLVKLISVAERFNVFFHSPNHHLFISNANAQKSFTIETPLDIVDSLKIELNKYTHQIYETNLSLSLNYGSFKKGGLKTFGCNYGMEIKFEKIKYSILLDEFAENEKRNRILQYENLLHKPLRKIEINRLSDVLGKTILDHIEFYTKKHGLR